MPTSALPEVLFEVLLVSVVCFLSGIAQPGHGDHARAGKHTGIVQVAAVAGGGGKQQHDSRAFCSSPPDRTEQ